MFYRTYNWTRMQAVLWMPAIVCALNGDQRVTTIPAYQDEPLSTIGQVVKTLAPRFPDVTVSSIRFLEREGLIAPVRRSSGHRAFRAEDIERVRTIKRWQEERLSLAEIRQRFSAARAANDLPGIGRQFGDLLLAGRVDDAISLLTELYDSGTPLLDIAEVVIDPAMKRLAVDDGCALIGVDVQMELDERLSAWLARIELGHGRTSDGLVALGVSPTWERHDLALRVLAALMAERGADLRMLGAHVEAQFVVGAIRRVRPALVLVSMTMEPPRDAGLAWLREVRAGIRDEQRLVVGGRGRRVANEIDGVVVLEDEGFTAAMAEMGLSRR